MTDLILIIAFLLSGGTSFNPADAPEQYQLLDKSGNALSEEEISKQCTGACYDYWKQVAIDNQEQLKDGWGQDWLSEG